MSSIQNISSYSAAASSSSSSALSTSSKKSSIQHSSSRRESNNYWDKFLPITSWGFDDTRSRFDHDFKNILDDWHEQLKRNSCIRRATILDRRLDCGINRKSSNGKPDNEDFDFISAGDEYKISMNVGDLRSNEMTLRVVGRKRLAVEGRIMDGKKNNRRHTPLENLRFVFSLPEDAEMDTITSALSSDGLLTIVVPKIVHGSATHTSGTLSSMNSKTSIASEDAMNLCEQRKEKLDYVGENYGQTSQTQQVTTDHINSQLNNKKQSHNSTAAFKSINLMEDMDGRKPTINRTGSKTKTTFIESKEIDESQVNGKRNFQALSSIEGSYCTSKSSSSIASHLRKGGHSSIDVSPGDSERTIMLALEDLLSKRKEQSLMKTAIENENNILTSDVRQKMEVKKLAEDNLCYTFVVDVQDFLPSGEISVRSIGKRELVIECQGSQKEISNPTNSFTERVLLPEDAQIESAQASVMISEGLLIIIVSKKSQTNMLNEFIVPIAFEDVSDETTNEKLSTQMTRVREEKSSQQSSTKNIRTCDEDKASLDLHQQIITDVTGSSYLQINDSSVHESKPFMNQVMNIAEIENAKNRDAKERIQEFATNNIKDDKLAETIATNKTIKFNPQNDKTFYEKENKLQFQSSEVICKEDEEFVEMKFNGKPDLPSDTSRVSVQGFDSHKIIQDSSNNDKKEVKTFTNKETNFKDTDRNNIYVKTTRKQGHSSDTSKDLSQIFDRGISENDSEKGESIPFFKETEECNGDANITIKLELTAPDNDSKETEEYIRESNIIGQQELLSDISNQSSQRLRREISQVSAKNYEEETIKAAIVRVDDSKEMEEFYKKESNIKEQGELTDTLKVSTEAIDLDASHYSTYDGKDDIKIVSLEGNHDFNKTEKYNREADITKQELLQRTSKSTSISSNVALSQGSTNEGKEHKVKQLFLESNSDSNDSAQCSEVEKAIRKQELISSSSEIPRDVAIDIFQSPTNINKTNVNQSININGKKNNVASVQQILLENGNTVESQDKKYYVEQHVQNKSHMKAMNNTAEENIKEHRETVSSSEDLHASQGSSLTFRTVESNEDPPLTFNSLDQKTSIASPSDSSTSLLVQKRGQFAEDDFFEGVRKQYLESVEEIMTKYGDVPSTGDELSCYANLWSQDVQEDHLVSISHQDEDQFKIIIDVSEYSKEKQISVKVSCGSKILIEYFPMEKAEIESSNKICKCFILPNDFDVESAICGISSDGFLAITFTKKNVSSCGQESSKLSVSEIAQKFHDKTSYESGSELTLRREKALIANTAKDNEENESKPLVPINDASEDQTVSTQVDLTLENNTPSKQAADDSLIQYFSSNVVSSTSSKMYCKALTEELSEKKPQDINLAPNEKEEKTELVKNSFEKTGNILATEIQNTINKDVIGFTKNVSNEGDADNCCALTVTNGTGSSDLYGESLTEADSASFMKSSQISAINCSVAVRESSMHHQQSFVTCEDMDKRDITSAVDKKNFVLEDQTERLEGTSASTETPTRYFSLPEEGNLDVTTASLSSDGLRLIESPKGSHPGAGATTSITSIDSQYSLEGHSSCTSHKSQVKALLSQSQSSSSAFVCDSNCLYQANYNYS